MRPILLMLMLLTALSSCVTQLTQAGLNVQLVYDRARVRDCKAIGRVREATGSAYGHSNAKKRLRNKAGSAGANVVLVQQNSVNVITGSEVQGIAYRCPW